MTPERRTPVLASCATLAAILSGCAPLPRCPSEPPSADAATATVVVADSCAGVRDGASAIWTAAHCVVERDWVSWRARGAVVPSAAEVAAVYPDRDLARLEADSTWQAPLVKRWPALNERALVVHHRCEGGWCANEGRVVYVSSGFGEAALDWTAPRGASGSGVWGQDGALLGIVTSIGTRVATTYFQIVANLPNEGNPF